ncbi:nuclear transport factor 2 family protein [Sphingobacterium sp. DK4209]|uniref:Nuclear transport factor 2 family protein n=1 Tax=Sphingobacterium zhuxiongii TaxID=2662364 RepID=A0A5Q0QI45_9SPHI|nr:MULTISPECIES: nuclear transport factor 2 family protein [unclassified Sphingobacterium]MVZ67617.1 nuclear transport factor 2 family protein [Sphingobacterium sp. DK4209]QGA27150.1 nuclear transport factor 2 family protein [Sphingobacterium sp. dk4302]
MIESNTKIVQSLYEAYVSNDEDAVRQILSDDIQWHIPGNHPLSETKKGLNDVLAFLSQLNKASFQASSNVVGYNDQFVIDFHRNWSKLDGEDNLNNMSCLLWKIENKKIVEVFNFPEDQHKVGSSFKKVYTNE